MPPQAVVAEETEPVAFNFEDITPLEDDMPLEDDDEIEPLPLDDEDFEE